MLYRGMDRAQLDIAHNNTLAVPERGEIVAGWAARSDLMRQKYGGVLDLRYGDTPRERLDLFLAAANTSSIPVRNDACSSRLTIARSFSFSTLGK